MKNTCYQLHAILLLGLIQTICAQPIITSQPKIQIMTIGATANFSVTVTGTPPLVYQWRLNNANLADKTNRSLTLANVQLISAGNYDVIVANSSGSVTSKVAGLAFTRVHRFEAITANPDHSISLSLAGVVPKAFAPYYDLYPLEVSTNLVAWSPLATVQRTNDSVDALSYVDPEAAHLAQRFYRSSTNFFITPFPEPTGPYAVGTISRLVTDPSRVRNTRPTNSSFMVTFWYPGERKAGVAPDLYVDKKITLAPDEVGNISYWVPTPASNIAQFVSHSLPGLPLATNKSIYPVVLYSHGGGGHRRQNTDKAQELASHGFIVVALDHKDAFASVFPSGQLILGRSLTYGGCGADAIKYLWPDMLDNRIKDLQFLVDELGRLNTEDEVLASRLDLERIGALGFSWGGLTVAEFGRIDARCKAVVILDSGVLLTQAADLTRVGLGKPFLSMNAMEGWFDCPLLGEWLAAPRAIFARATKDAYWCQVQDATHASFGDKGSLITDQTGSANPTALSRAQSRAIRACVVSFFDKYLKGEDDHLLDNPALVYSSIINFQRK